MKKITKRFLSLLICVALIASYIPLAAAVATPTGLTAGVIADPGTAHTWETMLGSDADGNRYAGRVWVDKSLYKDGDTAILNTRGEAGSSFQVSLEDDEAFQVIFSALGSTMSSKETVTSTGPMDVVLVLDDSTSMDDIISGNTTRLEKLIEASNSLLADLVSMQDVRIGIVAYNNNSMQILPFGTYNNGIVLKVRGNKYTFDEYSSSNKGGNIQAFDKNGTLLYNNTSGYARGTNVQAGVNMGLGMLEKAQNTQGRTPVAIVLTDGAANTAAQNTFYDIDSQTPRSFLNGTTPASVVLATLLNASYKKARVEDVYGKAPMIYGVGVDIDGNAAANAVINPSADQDGFNSSNSSTYITTAYALYQDWLVQKKVERTESYNGNHKFVFDHNYTGVTLADIQKNINYVDSYYPVASANLESVFQQIYQELVSGAFNPISSSTTVAGGTGVDDTPLIYVDFIGQHMEIKEIQTVTLFGSSYGVVKNADGTYTVTSGTGTNPTTNEKWNTAEDIKISVTKQADGTQKLEIRINQEILPIIMEKVESETVGNVTTSTITQLIQEPLRVYYTVGMDSEILLPGGEVDISKLQGYAHIDDANGTVSFYGGQFGVMNPANANGDFYYGDAHVGFQPSALNRYYYHQANQRIFSAVAKEDGTPIQWEEGLYGVDYNADNYILTDIDYNTYLQYNADLDRQQNPVDHQVYTYVKFWRPTLSTADAANAAEEVSYLVYTNWSDLRESVGFYDATTKTYLGGGAVTSAAEAAAYIQANPNAELYAVLGVGSLRTSRLHNMTVVKSENLTGTAIDRYAPVYTHENAAAHHGNDVVVWLGNNGVVTMEIDTGIALTKTVTEAIGNPDDTYELTVTVPAGVTANPEVVDENGDAVTFTYTGNVLTVNVKAGQTVYISGIPGGTVCTIGENVKGDYYIASKTDTVRIPLVSEALNGAAQFAPATVTNAPNKYGNLHITKEITSDHTVPDSVLNTPFDITVHVGAALAGKKFFVEDSAHAAPYDVTVDANGNLTFQIKARQTIDILDLPEGTAVTVTENLSDSHFAVSYRTRNHSGETADSDNAVVIPSTGSATAIVLNHYTPEAVTVDLDVVIYKNFADASVASRLEGGSFTFKVQKYKDALWENLATATVTYAANEYGEKSATIAEVLKNEIFTEAGTYSYRVYEEKGAVTNVSYDRIVYTFDVVVTDNGGQLEAKVIGSNNAEITNTVGDSALDYVTRFTNTYDTAPISMDIKKVIFNMSGDSTVSAAGFQFKSIAVDQNGNPLVPNQTNTIFSDAAGEARISGVYTREQIGTHYYIVYEENTGRPGWRYSEAQYFVTVVVEDVAGKLTATMTIAAYNEAANKELAPPVVVDGNAGMLWFSNAYDPEDTIIDLAGLVNKELTGKTLEKDAFTFYVCLDGTTTPILEGKNDENGNVTFAYVDPDAEAFYQGKIHIAQAGKIALDIFEVIPDGAVYDAATGKYALGAMYYDPTIYDLVIEVTNDFATGKLVVSYYFEDSVTDTVTFHNIYKPTPTTYTLGGHKVLKGRAPRNGEFAFELYENREWKQTVTNKADGSFVFKPITYTQAGQFTYIIREKSGSVPGVAYNGVNTPITVTVTVTDQNGVLTAKADVENADITFENTYTPKAAQVTFQGTKKLQGGTLADNAFTFKLYKTDNTFDIAASELLGTAQNENGAFAFERILDATGTYYFVIAEDAANPMENVVYDRTHHKFVVRVSDIGDGQLKALVTNVTTGVSTPAAASVNAQVAFVNATFDEVTEKEVYLEGNAQTQIDGQKVNAGDILTYFITYHNYTGENVVADIADVIPLHTSYVEGSASHNGTYAGTHLNWILDVAKGESVTVSFQVKVDATEAVVANTAVVRDGVNTYHTNEVVNHTVDNPLIKEVFSAADTTVNIDGQQVAAGDELLYKISFTNASANNVDIQITDAIPTNTTYVEGSVTGGGVYASGAIVWDLKDIPAWETVTVSFKVTVNADIGAATIENKAAASDGTNNYTTNVVTNTTPEPPTVPTDPTTPSTPTEPTGPSNPQTGDTLNHWFTILILSCGGFIITATRRKKEEATE